MIGELRLHLKPLPSIRKPEIGEYENVTTVESVRLVLPHELERVAVALAIAPGSPDLHLGLRPSQAASLVDLERYVHQAAAGARGAARRQKLARQGL